MPAAINILFGASFTIATCWALGTLLMRRLALPLYRLEERLLAFVTGSACLSAIVFVLCLLKLAHKGVFLVLGLVILTWAFRSGAYRAHGKEFAPLGWLWKLCFLTVFGFFTYLYFFNAMAPEMSPDGMAYHLATVAKYYRAHGFTLIQSNFYSNLSQGVELLFLYAFAFGRHSAATLVHFAFLVTLCLLLLAYGRRIGRPEVGVAGALFFYASPIVGRDGTVAYVDVALAAVLFSLFYVLQIWLEDPHPHLLAPIGILGGFGFAIKYTALLALPYALGIVVWKLWRTGKPILRPALTVALLAGLSIVPWMAKNWISVGDPVAPFANRLFPNPYVHVSFEDDWLKYERLYTLTSYWQMPLELTVSGNLLTGLFGPLFLLTPLALLSLRFREGRQLLLAGGTFALPYIANIGTRFLIPAAPFLSLAIALAFAKKSAPDPSLLRDSLGSEKDATGAAKQESNTPGRRRRSVLREFPGTWLLLALVLGHAVSCWPNVLNRYCGGYAWRILRIPVKAALRIEPEGVYLARSSFEYNIAQMLEKSVPRTERVFAFSQTGESYTSREVLSRYTAALNESIGRILWTPLFDGMQPTRIIQFEFPAREVQRIRVRQTVRCTTAIWSVAELRVFRSSRELPRAPEWRLSANPNPWEVQMAFDNSGVTEWRTWQIAEPGMWLQVDFGRPESIDKVVLESPGDDDQTKSVLEAMNASGNWAALSAKPQESRRPVNHSLRWEAAQDVKALGIRYVLVIGDDIHPEDFQHNAALWGMKCVGTVGSARLYHIE